MNSIRTFYRLCNGPQTLALVDESDFLSEIVDEEWAHAYSGIPLPAPRAALYQTHSRVTLCGGHVCMIPHPNGEMKIIADGVQIFRFWDGRWTLTDAERKYQFDAVGKFPNRERISTSQLPTILELMPTSPFIGTALPEAAF